MLLINSILKKLGLIQKKKEYPKGDIPSHFNYLKKRVPLCFEYYSYFLYFPCLPLGAKITVKQKPYKL